MDVQARLTRLGTLLLAAALLAVAGCVSIDTKAAQWPWCDRPATGPVAQMVIIWGDGLVVQPDRLRGGAPMPGFAGRLYLFGKNLSEPHGAEGGISVCLYDMNQKGEQRAPKEIWNISPENLERVLKKDALGWGYDLWLPWSTYDPAITRVSLVVQYQAPEGLPVWSTPSELVLNGPGKTAPGEGRVAIKSFSKNPATGQMMERKEAQAMGK